MAKPFKAKMPAVPTKRPPKSSTSANIKTLRVGTKRKR